ncbi:hypothetical protein RB195_018218 [Necator americanus]|uniref:Uncharacterized protein n=1 Tax=Necator americanus TaxID=51031 RepID=A0ABR1C8R4_NECAM
MGTLQACGFCGLPDWTDGAYLLEATLNCLPCNFQSFDCKPLARPRPGIQRIQAMKVIDGVPEYTGLTDIVVKLLRKEGVFAFWKGFTPYYMRLGPHTVLTFIFLEQFNRAYVKNFARKKKENNGKK